MEVFDALCFGFMFGFFAGIATVMIIVKANHKNNVIDMEEWKLKRNLRRNLNERE